MTATGVTSGLGSNETALLQMLSLDPRDVLTADTSSNAFTWTFNSGDESFDYLASGQVLNLDYLVRLADDSSTADQTIRVAITGSNDSPEISAELVNIIGAVSEDLGTVDTGTPTAQVTTLDLQEDYEAGDVIDLNINGSTLSYTIQTSDLAQVSISNDFSSNANEWVNGQLDSNAELGQFLGRYKQTEETSTTINLAGQASTIGFDFYAIDSWDGNTENFEVWINNVQDYRHCSIRPRNRRITQSGTTNVHGEGDYNWTFTPVGTRSELFKDSQQIHSNGMIKNTGLRFQHPATSTMFCSNSKPISMMAGSTMSLGVLTISALPVLPTRPRREKTLLANSQP